MIVAAAALRPAPARTAGAGRAGVRLAWLHVRSRRVPAGILALALCGGVLRAALHWHWAFSSGPYAQQIPMIIEAGAAAVIAVTSHSPFGETERATGRWLPYLRLFAAAGMCGLAIALLQLGAAGESLNQGILVLARNVTGITGIGLLCSLVTGGLLAWALPMGYLAFCQYALLQGWTAPWTWPVRPQPTAAPGSAPARSSRSACSCSPSAAPAPASATKVSRIHRHTRDGVGPVPRGYRPRSPSRPTPNQPAQNLSVRRRRGLGQKYRTHCCGTFAIMPDNGQTDYIGGSVRVLPDLFGHSG